MNKMAPKPKAKYPKMGKAPCEEPDEDEDEGDGSPSPSDSSANKKARRAIFMNRLMKTK